MNIVENEPGSYKLGLSRYAKNVSRYIAICGKHIAIIPQYIVPKCQDTFWVKMKKNIDRRLNF